MPSPPHQLSPLPTPFLNAIPSWPFIAPWAGASEHVKVYVRVRPPNEREKASSAYVPNSQSSSQGSSSTTISINEPHNLAITMGYKNDAFVYDCVGGEQTTQEQVFKDVGKLIVEQCVKGYNGTIFAYGQTGSGKTYTMQGPSNITSLGNHPDRGIIPRCMEYLFELIEKEEQMVSSVKYLCKASYIEIYNENIYDLLDNSAVPRSTREDIKRGVYVDGVSEESIHNPEDAYKLFEQGAANRHTSATAMNRESSRSHTVLTLTIQSMELVDGINHIRESRFNLVDLAGSERQKQANTEGIRLKEAGNINKSLLCLGSVINALGEIAGGHSRYVHYRDSRLTFLLKDSLGGNSNTFIVANVSPSALCYQESLSTLRFAQRAKMIKNKAVVNEDIQGNINELRAEIQRLKAALALQRATGNSGDQSLTNKMLLETLAKLRVEQKEHADMTQKGFLLDAACKALEKQNQSAHMIIKFKESALATYRKGLTAAAHDAEKSALQEEITQLRRQLDFHPEVLKVKAENMSLREMLQKYEKYQSGLEESEEENKKNKEYFHDLSGKVLALEQENETLRAKLGSATPNRTMDMEDIDFPRIEGIEDIMQESPPKIRDEDRRFSSDMKSLLQKVTKSRQAEFRRLSGNHSRPDLNLQDGSDKGSGSPFSLPSTPLKKGRQAQDQDQTEDFTMGENLSDSIFARSTMHSDDTVEMTLLKRDLDRLKDENSVLVDDKASLDKELADSHFQLIAMEKCLDQATNQAEQLGRDLQLARNSLSAMEQEATTKIRSLDKEREDQVEVLETMQRASIILEQDLEAQKKMYREVEQQLKATTQDLDDSRQRLLENQKEYDHQVEYNMKRIKEFQEKEARWDETRTEVMKAKEELERQLEQERARTSSTRSKLEKEHQKLLHDCEALGVEKKKLEDSRTELEAALEGVKKDLAAAAAKHDAKLQDHVEQHQSALEVVRLQSVELEKRLGEAQDRVQELTRQHDETKAQLEIKAQESSQTLLDRERHLEEQIKALEAKRLADLEECESKNRSEVELSLQTLRQTLVESHAQEIEVMKSRAEEQRRVLEQTRVSLAESVEQAENAQLAKEKIEQDLQEVRAQCQDLVRQTEMLGQTKILLESQLESMGSKCLMLEATLDDQRLEMGRLALAVQQEKLDRERVETARVELRNKVSEMAHKIGETEQKLEQARDGQRMLEMEYRTVQDELEHQLSKAKNELAVKTSENMLNEEYKRKFRELKAQFADLGPTVTQRQQQGFHERELKRTMELEKLREEMHQAQVKTMQVEANLALAQEMNEELLGDAKMNTIKIAQEMEKRLLEVESQRQRAQEEVEQTLEAVQKKTIELQVLEEEALSYKERIEVLEGGLKEERQRAEKLENALVKKEERLKEEKSLMEEQEENESENKKESLIQLTEKRLKEEQLVAQRELLKRMKQEQQELAQKQREEHREKTMGLFTGMATVNGKLVEQLRDLGMVNENLLKHQNPKQKLQYHVKIKQENNELRMENQRLMFKTIELEERLGNKDNVETLRKRVKELHGENPFHGSFDIQSLLQESDLELKDVTGMEVIPSEGLPIQRSASSSPPLSSEASSTASGVVVGSQGQSGKTLTTATAQKRKVPGGMLSHSSSSSSLAGSRKRQASTANTQTESAQPVSRQRTMSGASTVSARSIAATDPASTSHGSEVPLGPRARAKAASDAALAASKFVRRQGTPVPTSSSSSSTPSAAGVSARSFGSAATSSSRISRAPSSQRVTAMCGSAGRTTQQEDPLRGPRGGGAISKPRAPIVNSAISAARASPAPGSTGPVIGAASAQRALAREARLAAATAAAAGATGSRTTHSATPTEATLARARSREQTPMKIEPATTGSAYSPHGGSPGLVSPSARAIKDQPRTPTPSSAASPTQATSSPSKEE